MNNVINTLSYVDDEALIQECRKRGFQIQKIAHLRKEYLEAAKESKEAGNDPTVLQPR